jgi:hypothetical protein
MKQKTVIINQTKELTEQQMAAYALILLSTVKIPFSEVRKAKLLQTWLEDKVGMAAPKKD